ncbi:ferredoxin [Mycobacteroides abscessus subsp. bolletii]|nr:ferredoxin [Mycobacteroides abscessus subsp. bolletii]SKH25766.1 ferredoxin [Mycobacteroides abscessus subsp. bolletii]
MTHVDADLTRCEGHGLCEQIAPDVYRVNDDGEVELLIDDVPEALRAQAEAGAHGCPVAALRIAS